jgi:hypothetical protein
MNFQQNSSGQNAVSRNPDVMDNGGFNANSADFRHWHERFADAVANSLSGSGMGGRMAAASHQFNQRSNTPICLPSLFPRVKRSLIRRVS